MFKSQLIFGLGLSAAVALSTSTAFSQAKLQRAPRIVAPGAAEVLRPSRVQSAPARTAKPTNVGKSAAGKDPRIVAPEIQKAIATTAASLRTRFPLVAGGEIDSIAEALVSPYATKDNRAQAETRLAQWESKLANPVLTDMATGMSADDLTKQIENARRECLGTVCNTQLLNVEGALKDSTGDGNQPAVEQKVGLAVAAIAEKRRNVGSMDEAVGAALNDVFGENTAKSLACADCNCAN